MANEKDEPPRLGLEGFISNSQHRLVLGVAKNFLRQALEDGSGPRLSPAQIRAEKRRRLLYDQPVDDDLEEDGALALPSVLLFFGGHATGKTHLLRLLSDRLAPLGDEVLSSSVDELSNDEAGKNSLRRCGARIVLIDDAQRLSRRLDTDRESQEDLCLLIDRLERLNLERDRGGRLACLLLAGAGHPRDWDLNEGLRSRLQGGIWMEMPKPDMDIRLRYAQQEAKRIQSSLSREQLLLLAQHCTDLRALSGLIRRVASHKRILHTELDRDALMEALREGPMLVEKPVSPEGIMEIVGQSCGVKPADMLTDSRRPDVVRARQIAMYICRDLLGQSYPVLAKIFGGKDHSTVMYGVKKIQELREHDRVVHTLVTELTNACRQGRPHGGKP